ncbi:acyltransferase family protein [Streptomyces sp. DSM 40750]|uniref:acyltransferase family protein n=1 Tax=Streptomyces sp. DSM 40750 TaxID=2801030 RepID=UPI00214C60FF|nr:acyltransferase [Streptomyces sp. DSM 40750]UUU22306.1 acyltransferase [Streptomyces sp. DSM 40750]
MDRGKTNTEPEPEPEPEPSRTPAPRRRELDLLRALVVLGLVFFHAALVFSPDDDFYVKNRDTTDVVTVLAGLGVIWAMPMLFLVAGLGARFSIRRRGPARERALRLGVPLVFASLALNPLPQWLRLRAADPAYDEPYWRFWPRFLTVHLDFDDFPFLLDGRYFETGHLWFVVLLVAFCLLLVPVAAPLATGADRAGPVVARHPALLLLPAVPLALINALLGMEEDFAGWNRWAYLLFFLCGYALADDPRVRAALRRAAVPVGVLGLVLFAGTAPGFMAAGDGDDPFTAWTSLALVTRGLFGAAGWCWVLAILGLLDRPRPRPSEPGQPSGRRRQLWAYLALAAMPLYVLHQPVVVAFAYGVVGWSAPIVVKYVTIVAGSLVVILVAYEYGVRRIRVSRFLFGMRPQRRDERGPAGV